MTTIRLRHNGLKGLMLFSLFTVMSIKSCIVNAQSTPNSRDQSVSKKIKAWDDSIRRTKPKRTSTFLGAEISLAFPQHTLKSKIAALDGLRVNYIGTNLGGVVGNSIGKLKANVGLYYSEPSVPYTMEMLQAAISGTFYVLRINQVKDHSFEPYVSIGLARQQTKYYGNYLPSDNGITPPVNYSVTEQPLLGKTGFTQLNSAIGVEYQIQSCNTTFVHLFTEMGYGFLISSNASNQPFSGTRLSNSTTFSLGINFGISK